MLRDDWKEFQKGVSRLVARAWLDEGFKENFIANPAQVLAENGLTLPSGVEVRVNQNTLLGSITNLGVSPENDVVYEIALPPKPDGIENRQIRVWADGEGTEPPRGMAATF